MERHYKAFISYRHRPLDIAVAMKVHKCIERFKIPADLRREEKKNPGSVCKNWNGAPPEKLLVFRDRDELPLSNDLTSDIFEALDSAPFQRMRKSRLNRCEVLFFLFRTLLCLLAVFF